MIKRKPDFLVILAALLFVGVVVSSVLLDRAPDDSDEVATGFHQPSEQNVAMGAR